MKFNIGDTVWAASFEPTETYITCPDCCGEGRLRVIMGDGTEVSVGCRNCEKGYMGPQGRLTVYDRRPFAKSVKITGAEIQPDGVRYHYHCGESYWHTYDEENLFADEPGAVARAQEMAVAADAEERSRILNREKDTRSWAWNANYHRQCIARAKKDIAYHESKLAVASLKAKEAKAGSAA